MRFGSLIYALFLSAISSGCATHAPLLDEVPSQFTAQASNGAVVMPQDVEPYLVSIVVPFAVESLAINRFNEVFVTRQLTAAGEPPAHKEPDINDRAGQDSLSKTVYYALELYDYLSDRFGADSVYLHPIKITLTDQGGLHFEELRPMPPTILKLGFFAYNSPLSSYYGVPKTAANRITPVITLKTRPEALPETKGWIVNNEHLLDNAFEEGVLVGPGAEALSFFDVIADPTNYGEIERHLKARTEHVYSHDDIGSRYMVWPLISYEMDGETMFGNIPKLSKVNGDLGSEVAEDSVIQPASPVLEQHAQNREYQWNEYLTAIGNVIEAAAGVIDIRAAVHRDWTTFISEFDPLLAETLAHSSTSVPAAESQKAEALRLFLQTEKKFYNDQSRQVFETVYLGEYGQAVRSLLTTEYQAWLDIKSANTRNTVLAIGLGLVTGGLGVSAMAMLPVAEAMENGFRNLQNEMFDSISTTYQQVQTEMHSYELTVMGRRHNLTTSNSAGLREMMKEIYQASFCASGPGCETNEVASK